ncbi:uncharacterized protein PODANS_5_1450 [Podospora anserina S mat+]|uniref:Podospora anserina S mat+ genomic DNA chromosome 5, supercontig 1 n=1 Tax=Podospora anserina (strain S / ATCC MYA-4624 / DSM 980 / FGSC 10383) TaxID=515849 RepID=B2AEV0_PODAN|nr:uncharacterized protein PODANS_5_1450 [Podospora anserina S mat+]CAP61966.1 unnamed protein product [Podospora anserina S mat+]CDP29043.1 Putative protein of unknown function [Podospora anserina S mat+]
MEQFLIDNADRYKELVQAFNPKPAAPVKADSTNPDFLVSTRIRPLLPDEISQGFLEGVCSRPGGANIVDLHELKKSVRGLPCLNQSFSYRVDRVFGPDSTTKQIYDAIIQPLVPWAWGGGVSTMFAYGQTGSGKTFTVSGLEEHVAETLMDGTLEGERKLYLLNSRKQISILEDSLGNTQLAGAQEHPLTSKADLLSLISTASSLRKTAPTLKNDSSSRSHAICRIRIENPSIPAAEDGLLYLIDLAGSEAARDKSTHDAARMREAREINTSLSVLKDCIRGRAMVDLDPGSGKKAHVPFRQSTLTKTLKHVFDPSPVGGVRGGKTVVVACVNPCLADTQASRNTLRYAELLRVTAGPAGKKVQEYDEKRPVTWGNGEVREWVGKNSGTPPVDGNVLAPTESGAQLLRLPVGEFVERCLKTPGVTMEQATAFQSKFWQLHVDNLRSQSSSQHSKEKPEVKLTRMERLYSSADIEGPPHARDVPFKERIRPGMVVSYRSVGKTGGAQMGTEQMGVVLSRADAVGERVRDLTGVQVNHGGENLGERYLCAMVVPAILPGAYDVGLWMQVVVGVGEMEAEVVLEWDVATRYYYLTV